MRGGQERGVSERGVREGTVLPIWQPNEGQSRVLNGEQVVVEVDDPSLPIDVYPHRRRWWY